MSERTFKTGDAGDRFGATLTAEALDLTGSSVRFVMSQVPTGKVIEGTAQNDEGTHVFYEFTEDDLDTPGAYRGEWEVTWPGPPPVVLTFPEDGFHDLRVIADAD